MGAGIENRITYDPDEITRLLENQLDKLKVFRFDSRYRSLLGESFINLAARWEKDILSRRNDPFTLVVCGEFKRGKSSLINALLGEDVTPVNVTPETVTLNRIIYGPHSNEAVLPGGKKGTQGLEACGALMEQLDAFYGAGKPVAAICAAPSIFGHRGYLKGRRATSYPSFEEHLDGAQVTRAAAETDGNVITGRGMGCSIPFALAVVEYLAGKAEADRVAESVVYPG